MVRIVGNDELDDLVACFFDDSLLEPAFSYASGMARRLGLLLITDFSNVDADAWPFPVMMLAAYPDHIEVLVDGFEGDHGRAFGPIEQARADLYAYETSATLGLPLYFASGSHA
jgi:hypothetical protein